MTLITGNTYPVRAELRGLGGVWNAEATGWNVPDDQAEKVRAIVARAFHGGSPGGIFIPLGVAQISKGGTNLRKSAFSSSGGG